MSQIANKTAEIGPTDALEAEVQEALAVCGGDALQALRVTLIANAFLEAEIESLKAEVSAGFARGRVRKPAMKDQGKKSH